MQPLGKQYRDFLKKLRTELSYDPVMLLLDIYLDTKTLIQRDICIFSFHCSIVYSSWTWNNLYVRSMDEYIKKTSQHPPPTTMHAYTGMLHIHKKQCEIHSPNLPFFTAWIPKGYYTNWNRSETNTIWFPLMCRIERIK